jgi:8-oxo-dGTP diphosphatase
MLDTQSAHLASFVFIRNSEGHVGFVLRSTSSWKSGFYGLPSGKVEIGESARVCAVRELEEEIGISATSENVHHALTMHKYSAEDKNPVTRYWIDVYFEVSEYEGQPTNNEPEKHSGFAWLDPANMPDNVIPDNLAALNAYLKGETYHEWGFGKTDE